jgi:hypothetical protein
MKVQMHDSRNNENVDEGWSYNNSWFNKKWWLTCDLPKRKRLEGVMTKHCNTISLPKVNNFDEWRWPNKTTWFMPIESHLEMHMCWINENMHFTHPHIVRTQVHTKYHLAFSYVQLERLSIFLLTYFFIYFPTYSLTYMIPPNYYPQTKVPRPTHYPPMCPYLLITPPTWHHLPTPIFYSSTFVIFSKKLGVFFLM